MHSIPALRYAAAAARLGSFSAAARECGVKQPTVSAAISDLEESLGVTLFNRGARRLQLTPAGTHLMTRIAAILVAVDDLERSSKAITSPSQPQLRLGFTPLMGAARLGLLLDPYVKTHPGVDLFFFEAASNELEARLDAGSLDVIFGVGLKPQRMRKRAKLFSDALCYYSPSHKDVSALINITLTDITQSRLLLTENLCGLADATRNLLADAGLLVQEYPGRAMSYNALEDWVDLGLGGAVLPLVHVRNKLRALTLIDNHGNPLGIGIEAVWRKDYLVSEAGQELVSYLHRVAPQLAQGLGWHV